MLEEGDSEKAAMYEEWIRVYDMSIRECHNNNKEAGDYQERRRMGLRLFGQNSFSLHILRFLVQQNTALFSTFRLFVRSSVRSSQA